MHRENEKQLVATWIRGDRLEDLRYFEPRHFKDGKDAEIVRLLKDRKGEHEILKQYRAEYLELVDLWIPSQYEASFREAIKDLPLLDAQAGYTPEQIVEKSEAINARLAGSRPMSEEKAKGAIKLMRAKIEDGTASVIIPTGFPMLDEQIDGGLRAGLYIVGAVSSLGKTSFCIQLADQIAKTGKPVLFVSLEMAREELVAKILSRLTYKHSLDRYGTTSYAKTTTKILNTHQHKGYTKTEQGIINEALDELEARGDKLIIYEGIENVTVKKIKAKAKQAEKAYNEPPVVIVDYLQIIAPEEGYKGTDKQATDKNVTELKRLSRDLNTPVIAISSFNRDNYNEPVNLSSFKESGAIEYGSDVLLGIQLAGMDYQKGEVEKSTKRRDRIKEIRNTAEKNAKAGRAQALELKILKNRNGARGSLRLDFVPMFNQFTDAGKGSELDYTADFIEDDDLPIL